MKKEIKIGNQIVGQTKPCFVIAEIGVNHNGSEELAYRMIDAACETGADCVKLQTFKADSLVTRTSPKAAYQLKTTDTAESQYEMLKKLELSFEQYERIIEYCRKKNISFLSTPYSFEDVDFLTRLKVNAFKIASGQLSEIPFLSYVAKQKRPIIASTGMSYLSTVDEAVRTFRSEGNDDFVLLQCTTNYPSALADSNIRAMSTMESSFGCLVGYSDHTENDISVLAAVARGAVVIEKHFTLDKSLPGPDHICSADPAEFAAMVRNIRMMETCLGSTLKVPTDVELLNAAGMKRSLVASRNIEKNQIITEDMIAFKRPASGISPNMMNLVVGKKTVRSIEKDELLSFGMLNWEK